MYHDKLIVSPSLWAILERRGFDMSEFEKWNYLPTTEGDNVMSAQVDSTNMSDASLEQEIAAKGLNAPRITNDRVEAVIAHEYYMNAFDAITHLPTKSKGQTDAELEVDNHLKRLTICVLVLRNGFIVTGESSCVDAANYDEAIGRKVARKMAIDKVWMLEGYVLRQLIYAARAQDDGVSHE